MLQYNVPDIDDIFIFPRATLPKVASTFHFTNAHKKDLGKTVHVYDLNRNRLWSKCQSLDDYIEKSPALAMLIIRNDSIIYEKYSKGWNANSLYPSFSMIKSLGIFPLIGIAIEEGKIESVHDPITKYVSVLRAKEGFEKITIQHLLDMKSGIYEYESPVLPYAPQQRYYYGKHLEKETEKLEINYPPGMAYQYSVASTTTLLGEILKKVYQKPLDSIFYEKIWSQIGSDSEAYWAMDREKGNIKPFCCFHGNIRDFARLGRLILKGGEWEGKQVVPQRWVNSIFDNVDETSSRYLFLSRGIGRQYYSMHWYVGMREYKELHAAGFYGQHVILFPEQNTIVVSFTNRKGVFKRYPFQVELFYQIMEELECING